MMKKGEGFAGRGLTKELEPELLLSLGMSTTLSVKRKPPLLRGQLERGPYEVSVVCRERS